MMRKIQFNIKYFFFISVHVAVFPCLQLAAQELKVISAFKEYRTIVEKDSLQKMVEIKSIIPQVVYDLRYATKTNFTGKRLYPQGSKTFVRLAVARALAMAQNELAAAGYGVKIWDAYRPYAVTKKMWELIGDDRYVANPAKGSGHNRGLAVDVTLVYLSSNTDVDMGTGFDNFTDSAHHDFVNLPATVLKNRQLLKTVMEKHGFKALDTEWWHYSFPNNHNYDVLDLSFRKLGK